MTARKPRFAALAERECRALLQRNHIGRLAFLNKGVVDIEPLSYVAAGPWLFMRSAEGAKLDALPHRPYVAFQVDEIDGLFDWRSVVVHGTVYPMSEAGVRVDRLQYERALRALRSFAPATLTKDDPTPFRRRVYGIHVDRVDGRSAARHDRPARKTR